MQGRKWCFTLNNYTADEVTALTQAASTPSVSYMVFGRERGDQGTPHLQGYVFFTGNQRLAAVKNKLGSQRFHLELARGTHSQNRDYCTKENDYEEFGDCPTTDQGKRSEIDAFMAWVKEAEARPTARDLLDHHPAILAKYPVFVQEALDLLHPVLPQWQPQDPRQWQADLEAELSVDGDDRSVLFVVDPVGGAGKTWFKKMMIHKRSDDVQLLTTGKRGDIAFALNEQKTIFLVDVQRSQMQYLDYSILESLKDGMIWSPKYGSKMKYFKTPNHVVVFCNESPDVTKLSRDRIRVIELSRTDTNITN